MNRRELMKFFAIGTVIAPVAAETVRAKLVSEPDLEILTPAQAVAEQAQKSGWVRCDDPATIRGAEYAMEYSREIHVSAIEKLEGGGALIRLVVIRGSPISTLPLGDFPPRYPWIGLDR